MTKVEKPETEVLAKALEGRASLEINNKSGVVTIVFIGAKEAFWVDYSEMKKIMADFEVIVTTIKK